MRVGLVGFAAAGKTTVFNALTGLSADTGYGGKDRANLGIIKVPDARVEIVSRVFEPKKKTLAEIAFVDVAGPEAKSTESGLDTRITNEMRQVDALVHVVRDFESPLLTRPPDPLRDLAVFEGEVVLTDLVQVDTRLERLRKEGTKSQERTLIEHLHAHLEAGKPLRNYDLSPSDRQLIHGFALLSIKPCIVLINRADDKAAAELSPELYEAATERGLTLMSLAARAEEEIGELSPEDQSAFLEDLGLQGSARDRFIQTAYAQLDLISFLTVGPDECRAWTIERGTNARAAAGKIHSDLERGFIRAEVIAFSDFEEHGSEAKCRDVGKLRVEGKDYVVQVGDLLHISFNV
ncbi:MAG: DUF933 domain-containing protein [Myxococcota bacterium]